MLIKTKLSLYFTIISAVLLLIVLLIINLLFRQHTTEDFFKALKERAIVAAQVYLEADEITDSSLLHFKEEYLNALPEEVIRMYDSTNNPAFIKDTAHYWSANRINEARRKKDIQYADKDRQVVGIRYDDNQGSFVILASAIDKAGRLRNQSLFRNTLILYIIQLLVLFFIGRWFAKRALDPVKKINGQVQKINATDLHFRVDEGNGKDEIRELAMNFNNLLNRLETSFEIQKSFVNTASHELRTPLTSIIGEIEVAVSNSRSADEYKHILKSVLTEAEKLNTTIDGLLSLENAKNMIALEKIETVRLDAILWELQDFFKKKYPNCTLNIEMKSLPEDESELCIQANKHLLHIALSNIVRNAFKFSCNQPVDTILENCPDHLSVKIIDKGIGITQDDLKKVFQPFYRAAEANQFEGQGMGLFISKKILDLYRTEINLQSQPGKGTIVTILFRK